MAQGSLDGYHLAHAARADMQRRLGLTEAARASYRQALELARQPAEQRFIMSRLGRLQSGDSGWTSIGIFLFCSFRAGIFDTRFVNRISYPARTNFFDAVNRVHKRDKSKFVYASSIASASD
ncbi:MULTISPECIES: hypothetical protein [unclassified Mesorhizobium]|uniref:hypothetical protein n=1 Tax=unclassified Mesorhizobium TaxID=325217 RepID=UPI001FDA78F5|nr:MULTISPECIES: hypothetical protein [unclassified Mesorhizobium]